MRAIFEKASGFLYTANGLEKMADTTIRARHYSRSSGLNACYQQYPLYVLTFPSESKDTVK